MCIFRYNLSKKKEFTDLTLQYNELLGENEFLGKLTEELRANVAGLEHTISEKMYVHCTMNAYYFIYFY